MVKPGWSLNPGGAKRPGGGLMFAGADMLAAAERGGKSSLVAWLGASCALALASPTGCLTFFAAFVF